MARPASESVEVTQAGARWRGSIRIRRRAWVPKAAAAPRSPRELQSSQPSELAPSPRRPADAEADDAADDGGGAASTPQPEGLSNESRNLLDVIRSFYTDMLEPLDHHVVRELETRTGRRSSLSELRQLASVTPGVERVEDPGDPKRSWLYLEGIPREFVDQRSLEDTYPSDLWPQLAELVDRHAANNWGKSRFDCAKLLRSRMPALSSYPLGKVCHIVQLAVRLHSIFGYRNGWIVHYQQSLDFEKSLQAGNLEGDQRHHLPVLDWEQFTECLQELLNSPRHPHGLALSALKAIFRTQYGAELTETALGYPKLSSVFEDARLTPICRIESRGSEKFVRRASDAAGSPDTWDAMQLRNARGAGMSYAHDRGGRVEGRGNPARAEASSSAEAQPIAGAVPMPAAFAASHVADLAHAEAGVAAAVAAGEAGIAPWQTYGQSYVGQWEYDPATGNYTQWPLGMQQQDPPGYTRMIVDGQVTLVRAQDLFVVQNTFLEVYETQSEQPRLSRARSAPSRSPP